MPVFLLLMITHDMYNWCVDDLVHCQKQRRGNVYEYRTKWSLRNKRDLCANPLPVIHVLVAKEFDQRSFFSCSYSVSGRDVTAEGTRLPLVL